jgi:carbonic anhydrase
MDIKLTAPIDITNNSNGICDLKCKYSYKYKDSISSVTINDYYLSLTYENSFPEPVLFNSNSYNVSEIRIYSPSLHSYSGDKADAEIIINHTSAYGNILVCIPLITNESVNGGTQDLDNILTNVSKYAKITDETAVLQKSINLNNFIPQTKYYVYNGTLLFPPCNGDYTYIVFNKIDGGYKNITQKQLSILQDLIKKNTITTKPNVKFYVNNNGPGMETTNSDDIYIDCKPLIQEDKIENNSIKSFNLINIDTIKNSIYFKILIGFLLMCIIIKIFNILLSNFDSYYETIKIKSKK